MAPNLRPVDQIGMDEQTIEADSKAKAAIERLELPEGGVARVGRFRITRTAVPARSVSFETEASSRISIGLVEE